MNRNIGVAVIAPTAATCLLAAGMLMGCRAPEEPAEKRPGIASTAAGAEGKTREAAAARPESALAGTGWRLVEFQSMDDATGTVKPGDPSLYTMRLNADGTVNMRLNCNRANGTWSAEPGDDASSGGFQFGPLAATRAFCPPPSLDERIAADSAFVRSYMLKDGRLYLSLMADGGIYAWEPYTEAAAAGEAEPEVPFETKPDADLEAAILRASPDYTRKIVEIDGQSARYVYGRVDLNGDGKNEVFVYLVGSFFCGSGGCNLLLLTGAEEGYSLINTFPISRVPVIVSEERTNGWNDVFRLESGGGAPASYVRHAFNGKEYAEQERMPAQTAPGGTKYLAGAFAFEGGIPLNPRS